MRKIFIILSIFFATALFAAPKGCYEMYKISKDKNISTAVFVLIDETTPFNDSLKNQIITNSLSFVKETNYLFVGKFSALVNGKYNETLFDFILDISLSDDEKYEINKNTLAKIEKCLKDQTAFVRKSVKASIENAFMTNEIPKSDIIYALQDFAATINAKNAKRKIVILASDMLENSSISSFYANNTARQIDPKKELQKIEKNSLFADFGGAEIYVIGAGLTTNKKAYIDPKKLGALKEFWNEYFSKSNSTLKEFGTPSLKSSID